MAEKTTIPMWPFYIVIAILLFLLIYSLIKGIQMKYHWTFILFWFLTIIVLIMLFSRLFGKSATEFQIIVGTLSVFFTSITTLFYKIGKIEFELKDFKTKTINSFEKIGKDLELIKKKIKI